MDLDLILQGCGSGSCTMYIVHCTMYIVKKIRPVKLNTIKRALDLLCMAVDPVVE